MNIVFLDLEMNSVPGKQAGGGCRSEIIQIGAARIEGGVITGTFDTYVRPVVNPEISRKIRRLTGITTEMVRTRQVMADAMEDFLDWCGDARIYSWSDADLKQLRHEYAAKALPVPERLARLMENWVDYQEVFCEEGHFSERYSLERAANAVGIEASGRLHNARNDAFTTANVYLCTQSDDFAGFWKAREEAASDHGFCFGDLFDLSTLSPAV